jgi:HPt (histidine-containing phosphotransfer) domain-containing protein/two-component sensor histidine kinase/HAMP domain-containing protein
VGSVFALIILVVVAFIGAASQVLDEAARTDLRRHLQAADRVFTEDWAYRRSVLQSEARVVAEEPRLRAVTAAEEVSRETLVGVAQEIAKAIGTDLFVLTDARGRLLVDVADPEQASQDLRSQAAVATALAQGHASGVWTSGQQLYQVQAVRIDFGDSPFGVLVLGYLLDSGFLDTIERQSGAHAILLLDAEITKMSSGARGLDAGALRSELARLPVGSVAEPFATAGGRYLALVNGVPDYTGTRAVRYALVRSLDLALAPARRLRNLLGLIGALSLAAALFGASQLAMSLSRPVERLVDLSRRLGAGQLESRVTPEGPLETRVLALALNRMADELGSARESLKNQERIQRELEISERVQLATQARNRDLRLVLDNVGQGFLSLDSRAQLSSERSRVVHDWFGEPLPGDTFWQFIGRVDAQAGERFEMGWILVSDGLMPLELCLDQLPKLVHGPAAVFEVAYRPILEGAELERLLVVITDVSERVERERALAVERETMCVFRQIVSDREAFQEFFDEAGALVGAIQAFDGAAPAAVKRVIHTLKGNCAVYGVESVARLCHELESELADNGGVITEQRKQELGASWTGLAQLHAEFAAQASIHVTPDELQSLLSAFEGRAPAELLARLAAWRFDLASRRLALLGKQIQQLAERLDKANLQVHIEPSELRLPPKKWAPLWAALSHIVRNSVDHGVESPDARTGAGKPPLARLRLSLQRSEREIELAIEDDGPGIDWQKIGARARALGLPAETRAELEAAIFAGGVSSRTQITATSGRGVGLSAVHEVVQQLGGAIEVISRLGVGTTFRVHLPLSMLEEGGFSSDARPRS